MTSSAALDALGMAGLALVSVALWTLRVALTARGRKFVGAVTAAVEASVFAVVFASLVGNLDNPARIAGYAFGVAIGTLLGMSADLRLSRGQLSVRIVVEGENSPLLAVLRGRGWLVTAIAANGVRGPATVLILIVDDRCIAALLRDIRTLAPDSVWTIERLHAAHPIGRAGADRPGAMARPRCERSSQRSRSTRSRSSTRSPVPQLGQLPRGLESRARRRRIVARRRTVPTRR